MAAKIVSILVCCFLLFLANSFSIADEGFYKEIISKDLTAFLFERLLLNFIFINILTCLSYLLIWVFTKADNATMKFSFKTYYFHSLISLYLFAIFLLILLIVHYK
jgi:hypothetical protein